MQASTPSIITKASLHGFPLLEWARWRASSRRCSLLRSREPSRSATRTWRSHHRVSRDPDEARKRFDVFRQNEEFIHAFNNKESPYKLGLNGFADMTNEEFRSWSSGSDAHRLRGRRRRRPGEDLVGRARLHQDAERRGSQGRAVWHRHGSSLSHQNITQSFKDELSRQISCKEDIDNRSINYMHTPVEQIEVSISRLLMHA